MKKYYRALLLLPTLLLAGCNFHFKYYVPGLTDGSGSSDFDDDIDDAGTYDIKVWVDEKIVPLTKGQIANFQADSGGKYTINANVQPVSEGDAASNMLQDVRSGADIYVFAQDQLASLKVANAVTKLEGAYEEALRERNSKDSITAASINDNIYAMPLTSDNGYFLYYDKAFYNESEIKNMTTMISKAKNAQRRVYFSARTNGFYGASYFIALGLKCDWKINEDTGAFVSFKDTYNSDAGVLAAKGFKELTDTSVVISDANVTAFGASSRAAAAVVSGIWDYSAAEKILGDRLGCAALPNFTVDGVDYHLGSFDGYKLLGVKPQQDIKKASVCRKLALYLSNADCQSERFDAVNWGPTNVEASADPKIAEHPGLKALIEQHKYAIPQTVAPGDWFSTLSAMTQTIKATSSDAEIKGMLDTYTETLKSLLM